MHLATLFLSSFSSINLLPLLPPCFHCDAPSLNPTQQSVLGPSFLLLRRPSRTSCRVFAPPVVDLASSPHSVCEPPRKRSTFFDPPLPFRSIRLLSGLFFFFCFLPLHATNELKYPCAQLYDKRRHSAAQKSPPSPSFASTCRRSCLIHPRIHAHSLSTSYLGEFFVLAGTRKKTAIRRRTLFIRLENFLPL